MTEDILFSCILFYYAQKMSFSNHDGYFYFRNEQSSTINTGDIHKCKKNIKDLFYVLQNIKEFMESHVRKIRNRWHFMRKTKKS